MWSECKTCYGRRFAVKQESRRFQRWECQSEELDRAYKMKIEDGRLFVFDRNDVKRQLSPTIRDSFAVIPGPQFEFIRDAAGKVSGFAVHAGRIRNVRFTKRQN